GQAKVTLSSTTDTQNPYSPEQVRKARWGLGSAAMGDGFAVFNPWNLDITTDYMSWWDDEYVRPRARLEVVVVRRVRGQPRDRPLGSAPGGGGVAGQSAGADDRDPD